MLPPTPTASATAADLDGLANELRALYTRAFGETLEAANEARTRLETPDGTSPIDPVYAADTAACRAINNALAAVVARHLPGAQLLDRIDEPAVIDSHWLHQRRVFVIEWDYTFDFGDADGLTIWEATR